MLSTAKNLKQKNLLYIWVKWPMSSSCHFDDTWLVSTCKVILLLRGSVASGKYSLRFRGSCFISLFPIMSEWGGAEKWMHMYKMLAFYYHKMFHVWTFIHLKIFYYWEMISVFEKLTNQKMKITTRTLVLPLAI